MPNDRNAANAGKGDDRTPTANQDRQASDAASAAADGRGGRDRYRDNDDVRAPLGGDDRMGTQADSRAEARGDARENAGNHARGTDAHPTGASGNDRQRGRAEHPDQYDADLQADNRRGREASGMQALADDTRAGMAGAAGTHSEFGHQGRQHDRHTQAASPAERGHDEQPRRKEGHH